MTRPSQSFDWTAWYAKIPGVPQDWGKPRAPEQQTSAMPQLRVFRRLVLAR